MGLAASQARLLFLTSRKNDVEFGMMKLTNRKLNLTRSMSELSQQYNDKLNATTIKVNGQEANFENIMRAGSYIQDNKGRVVLNSDMSKFCESFGIPKTGTTWGGELRNKVLNAQLGTDNFDYETNYPIGNGQNISNNQSATSNGSSFNFNDIANAMGNIDWTTLQQSFNYESVAIGDVSTKDKGNVFETIRAASGAKTANSEFAGNSWAEVLSSEDPTKLVIFIERDENCDYDNASKNNLNIANAIFSQFTNAIMDTGLVDNDIMLAAYEEAMKQYTYENTQVTGDSVNGQTRLMNAQAATDTFGIHSREQHSAISLGNFIRLLMSYYETFAQGQTKLADAGFELNHGGKNDRVPRFSEGTKLWNFGDEITPGPNVTNVNDSENAELETGYNKDALVKAGITDTSKIDQIDSIFSAICSQGWSNDNKVDSEEYVANCIKNGKYVVKEQSNNAASSSLTEEQADSDKALAWYEAEKSKINLKEQAIDVEMKQLQTEQTELNTEYDSTKSLINSNIERTYKMFA